MINIPVYSGSNPILGCLPELNKDTIGILDRAHQNCGDAACIRFAHLYCYSFIHPEQVKHIFQDNSSNYTKDSRGFKVIQSILGQGVLTSKGALWKRQRQSAQEELKRKSAGEMVGSVVNTLSGVLSDWDQFEEYNINMHMALYAFYSFDKACLGADLTRPKVKEIIEIQSFLSRYLSRRSRTALIAPSWLPTPDNQKFKSAKNELSAITKGLIEQCRETYRTDQTLLARIMRDNEREGGNFDERMIRDEVYAFLVSGNESVGLTMQWLWYTLNRHPEYLKRIVEEMDFVVGKEHPTEEHFKNMPLLDAAIKEILRLYPPIFQLARRAVNEDEVGGYRLPAKGLVITNLYLIHRHKDFWDKPDQFYPERFLEKDVRERHPFSYMPFGRGPNQCLGFTIANIEMKCLAVMILQRYLPAMVKPEEARIKTLFTLHAEEPIHIKWKKRE